MARPRSAGVRVAVLLFEGFDELDAIGPYEVLRNARKLGADVDVELVTLDGADEVTGSGGVRVRPHGRLEGVPDVVVVPGGGWNDRSPEGARAQAERGDLPRTLASLHGAGATVATVCTGAMLAAAAGITGGRPATTHAGALDDLRASGAEVVDARVVDDGDLVTAGGVTAGIDLALRLVERDFGEAVAARVAERIEYERRPVATRPGRA